MESGLELDAEYDNRARVPEHLDIIAGWQRDAAQYREIATVTTQEYGAAARNKFDLFRSADSSAAQKPIIVFIHGGYWRSMDKDLFSHMAKGLNEAGYDVAMPGYTLCPDNTIAGICTEIETFCQYLNKAEGRPQLITGHSAGGHLAAWLCQKDTIARTGAYIIAGFGISGVYDLRPMLQTSINDDLRLDKTSAEASNPFLEEPQKDIMFDAWVGGDESNEFIRQSEMFAASWHTQGASTTFIEIAGANHFTAIDPLTNANSLMTKRIIGLASQ